MLFTNLVSTLATAAAILVPVAVAVPVAEVEGGLKAAEAEDGVKAMAAEFDIKWHGKKNCGDGGGPKRQLFKGVCVPLASTTHSVTVIDHIVGYKIRGYANGDCKGNSITAFSSHQCHNLDKVWSVRVGTA